MLGKLLNEGPMNTYSTGETYIHTHTITQQNALFLQDLLLP